MPTVTIPKTEYRELKKIAKRYRTILKIVGFDVPEESITEYKNAAEIRNAYEKSLRASSRR